MTCILAIDPGISGALAFYYVGIDRVSIYDMPILDGDIDPHELAKIIKDNRPDVAIIEKVHPMPKEGVNSVWRFATAYATARVVVMMLEIPCTLVPPTTWKNRMNLKGGKEGKEQCRNEAILKFPEIAAQLSRKKDHNRAEAAMLAVYASRSIHYVPAKAPSP